MLPIWNSLRFIVRHPLNRGRRLRALARYGLWQVGMRIVPGPVAVPFVGTTRLLVARGMTGATGNVYCGLHELEEMGFVMHFLRPGELFADVGANVGAFTVLAAGACRAMVFAAEADPSTFAALRDNVRLNGITNQVTLANVAIGGAPGRVRFAIGRDTLGHVASDPESDGSGTADVEMTTLDRALGESVPAMIKIDVEGYEAEVLRGASRILESRELGAVLVELIGSGRRYGFDEDAIHQGMLERGFTPCAYDPLRRALRSNPGGAQSPGNTLYVRDVARATERVRTADPFRVHGVAL